jgi:hypothetical protein|tara:strand:+ start:22 stop:1050 length:1029 start_codon:yes stop_codon:yes gene_type:complete
MGLPKKNKKDININPDKTGNDRRKEMFDDISNNGTYLPKGVLHEDMDKSFVEFVENGINLNLSGEKVPVIFLTIQRWAEFAKTWQYSDEYKNIKIPFITVVRKPDAQVGTNQAGYFNIPGKPTFTYMKVPTFDGMRKGMDIYKIPQPVPIDLTYEVRLFCNRMRDLNKMNMKFIQTFSPQQHYIKVNGHPMPLMMDSVGDESVISNLDERKYYVQMFTLKMMGYLLDEEDFEVNPAISRTVTLLEVSDNIKRSQYEVEESEDKTTEETFKFDVGISAFTVTMDINTSFTKETLKNIDSITYKVNGEIKDLPFFIGTGESLTITVNKSDTNLFSEVILNGVLT